MYEAGEMISDDDWEKFIEGESAEDIEKANKKYSKPWLKGTSKDGEGEIAYRFDGSAKAAFETWYLTVSDAKDSAAGLKKMLAKAGLRPN